MVSLLKQMICTHHLFDIVDFQESVGSTKKAKNNKTVLLKQTFLKANQRKTN